MKDANSQMSLGDILEKYQTPKGKVRTIKAYEELKQLIELGGSDVELFNRLQRQYETQVGKIVLKNFNLGEGRNFNLTFSQEFCYSLENTQYDLNIEDRLVLVYSGRAMNLLPFVLEEAFLYNLVKSLVDKERKIFLKIVGAHHFNELEQKKIKEFIAEFGIKKSIEFGETLIQRCENYCKLNEGVPIYRLADPHNYGVDVVNNIAYSIMITADKSYRRKR